MSAWPLRFVHASDLHLEQPPYGLADVPDHLRETLLEAPYQAAKRVFGTAIAEGVDFLVLAGDVVNPQTAGPRAILFLAEQFHRLEEAGIAVYWAGGRADPPQIIRAAIEWPENVHIFSEASVDEFLHHRDGQPVASIVGRSRGRSNKIPIAQLRSERPDLFTVGVAHGSVTRAAARQQHVAYLAAGGRHARQSTGTPQHLFHHSGSPQGRCPQETGPHGCTVVEIDEAGRPHTRFVTTDALRWVTEPVVVAPETSLENFEEQLAERIESLNIESRGKENEANHLLLSWRVSGHGPLLRQLRTEGPRTEGLRTEGLRTEGLRTEGPRTEGLRDELLDRLRHRFGFQTSAAAQRPVTWSVAIDVDSSSTALPHEWSEQDTILGDYLRLTEQYLEDPERTLAIESLLGEDPRSGQVGAGQLAEAVFAEVAQFQNPQQHPQLRERVLKEAAILGADLLGVENSMTFGANGKAVS